MRPCHSQIFPLPFPLVDLDAVTTMALRCPLEEEDPEPSAQFPVPIPVPRCLLACGAPKITVRTKFSITWWTNQSPVSLSALPPPFLAVLHHKEACLWSSDEWSHKCSLFSIPPVKSVLSAGLSPPSSEHTESICNTTVLISVNTNTSPPYNKHREFSSNFKHRNCPILAKQSHSIIHWTRLISHVFEIIQKGWYGWLNITKSKLNIIQFLPAWNAF